MIKILIILFTLTSLCKCQIAAGGPGGGKCRGSECIQINSQLFYDPISGRMVPQIVPFGEVPTSDITDMIPLRENVPEDYSGLVVVNYDGYREPGWAYQKIKDIGDCFVLMKRTKNKKPVVHERDPQ